MDNEIKPIETKYNGYIFRSRTEARWAVFLDIIGFRYQYEEQGYELSNKRWYLPDFKVILPNGNIVYIEVKNEEFDTMGDEQIYDLRLFSVEIGKPLIITNGQPAYKAYNMILPEFSLPKMEGNTQIADFSLCLFQDCDPFIRIPDEWYMGYLRFNETEGQFYLDIDDRQAKNTFGRKYMEAINASKSERFS